MSQSIFFRTLPQQLQKGKLTGLQRELLAMTLEANPGVTLGVAVQDVFDYLGIKIKKDQLQQICERLYRDNRQDPEPAADPNAPVKAQAKSDFGKALIKWVQDMDASKRLLVATNFDVERARRIYCEEDYLFTDSVCSLFLEDRWQAAQLLLEAAAAPWTGGKSSGPSGPVEVYDLSQAGDNDPQWQELAACFGG